MEARETRVKGGQSGVGGAGEGGGGPGDCDVQDDLTFASELSYV